MFDDIDNVLNSTFSKKYLKKSHIKDTIEGL